ncbi:AsmA-like C-terminal region-containing protein [Rhizobium sp. 32-5/1]|uniref:AsmA family protein n=1 Tax=Rhizobium sp. 32-5/1 TaxID=3019602 RepID=UPI00240E2968|nr:AsmA-like C-terminal region-containing protein [Rhizobium sp. 32-5/1]WEZ85153.1 AsmA-like C-terminal region-containing protein [Rhizobium sp. 32-5/1]
MVVALFAALIAPLFVDWTDFRKDFEREASRIMGKPVVVHGSVDARLIPFPSVTLNDVRVGQSETGEPLIQISRFSMDAELAPFLSGEALIFDMRLEAPKAKIRLLPDGTLDWARGRKASIPAKTVVLESVSITKGQIDFIDEQTGRTRRITDLSADLSARSLAGPWKVEGRAALDGEAGSFAFSSNEADEAGTLGLRTRLTPDKRPFGVELDGDLKIIDLKPVYKGKFTLTENRENAEVQQADAARNALRVTGGFELTNERIRVPEYRLEVGPKDDPYLVTGEATLDTGKTPEFLLLADGQQIDVSRIGNTGEAGKTGRDPAVSVRQRLAAMLAIAADIPIPQVAGRASLKLPAIVIGDTTVRDVRLDLRPDGAGWMIDNAVALLPGRTQLEAKGRLNLRGQRAFRGELLVASNQPSGLATWLAGSVDPAIRTLKTAGFSATVNLTETLQQFERLEVAAGPAILRGRIERQALDGADPSLSLQLKGNKIDLEALQALAGLVAGDASSETLLSHAIAADLSADAFSAFGETARNVQLVATLKNGQLQAERVSIGDLAGAQVALSGRMSGELEAPVLSAKMKLASPDLTPFLQMLERHAASHPALTRLAKSGPYYTDAALDLTLTAGSKDGNALVTFGILGTANGTNIAANYQAPDIAQALAGQGILLEATLENPSTPILLGQTGFDPLPFDADANSILSLKLQSTDADKANGALTFTTQNTSFSAKGDVNLSRDNFLDGTLKLTLQSQDFEPFLLLQGIGLPQMGSGLPLAATADVVTSVDAVALSNIAGKADNNAFSGGLVIDRKTVGNPVKGQIAVDTLDLAWIGESIVGPIEDAVSGDLSDVPVVQSAWTGFDVMLDVTAKQFWPDVFAPMANFSGKLVWKGDQVEIAEAAADWLGGKVEGRMLLGNGDGSGFFQTRLNLTGGDLAGVSWAIGGGPVAEGKFDLSLALEASGKSIKAMAESASGSGTATIDGLTVRGLNTGALPAILTAADGVTGEITPQAIERAVAGAVFGGQSVLGAVKVPFSIAGGTVRAQNVSAGDGTAALSADAEVTFPENRIKATLKLNYRPGEEALAGAEAQVSLDYAGLLRSPGVTLDVTDLSNFLSLRAFERERRRVETLQANVLEKQRLRREVALYKANAASREAERLRLEEEARRRKAAAEEAARLKKEAEARALVEKEVAEEAARAAAEQAAADKAAAAKAAEEKAAREAAEDVARKARALQNQSVLPVDPSDGVARRNYPHHR